MAGLDVRALYSDIQRETLDGPVTSALVSAEAALLTDDLEANVIPAFLTGMRNINSVMNSTFVTGKALLYDSRNKNVAKFSAQLRYGLIPVAVDRWKSQLNWNASVVAVYDQIIKSYYEIKKGSEYANLEVAAKNRLWPFGILEYERAVVGALNGAAATSNPAEPSTLSRGISGLASGAATGAMIGSVIPGVGTGVGAAIGGIIGLAGGLFG
ncbi:MAG: hypothetical protein DDT19_01890 [Syntrophomonadaceae bacterium]|nr:hypothetical protein [Bacillota bacterium]